MPPRLVVGLGNPGRAYAATRHNVGAWVLECLESERPSPIPLFRPTGYMNTSGVSVASEVRRRGLSPGDLVVVCDDFSLPLGRLRLREKGSAGGHNGLASILDCLGTTAVPRLRVGIGPVPRGQDPADFVLKPFLKSERALALTMVQTAAEALRVIAAEGWEAAMNRFNKDFREAL